MSSVENLGVKNDGMSPFVVFEMFVSRAREQFQLFLNQ